MRALASHQCGPGLNPGVDDICGLSLLLVLSLAPRGFSSGTPVFPSPKKPTFPNSNSTRSQVDEEPPCGCATCKSLLIYLFIYIYLFIFLLILYTFVRRKQMFVSLGLWRVEEANWLYQLSWWSQNLCFAPSLILRPLLLETEPLTVAAQLDLQLIQAPKLCSH